jgi:hypothetical protein
MAAKRDLMGMKKVVLRVGMRVEWMAAKRDLMGMKKVEMTVA